VTGGAGYIGSVTVERLLEHGYGVVVLDDLSTGHRSAVVSGVPLVVGDVGDGALVGKLIQQHDVGSVVHFAASSLVAESMERPDDYYQNNVVAGTRLLEAMIDCGVERIVFSSSAGVYGEPRSVPIAEDHPVAPVNVYGETKLAYERTLETFGSTHGLKYISLRYFNAAGASEQNGEDHDPETHLIPIALKVAAGLLPELVIFGDDYDTPDGTCIRDYIDVRDLADAHICALNALEEGRSGVYNLGNGEGFSVLEVVKLAGKVAGSTIPRRIGERRSGDPARLVASSRKAIVELSWEPRHPDLDDMIAAAWRWALDHPDGYVD
jgi:UDP-glucose 4-epimerase